jgi:hypothetical protein
VLKFSSNYFALLVCRQVPLAMDSLDYHIVVCLPPLDIRLLRVELQPAAAPKQSAVAQLTIMRELSIMSVGSPLAVRSVQAAVSYCVNDATAVYARVAKPAEARM